MKLNNTQKAVMKAINRDIKMVFFVRQDLKMGKGKIGSQCGHASIGLYKKLIRNDKDNLIDDWDINGSKKIVLKVSSEKDFSDILKYCEYNNILYHEVIDAGKTQIEKNSRTVISIIHENKKMHNLIHKYKLL